jgi:hypothetical protein
VSADESEHLNLKTTHRTQLQLQRKTTCLVLSAEQFLAAGRT